MQRSRSNIPSIHISGTFYLYIAALLIVLPLKWVIAFFLCSAAHELFHLLIAAVLGVQVRQIEIRPGGAQIHMQPATDLQELLCALAGPVGGLLPLLLLRIFPEAALWAVVLTIYNMLPIFPADGGRVLRSTAHMLFPARTADLLSNSVEWITCCAMLLLGLYSMLVLKLGVIALVICLLPVLRGKIPKMLANKMKTEYNRPIHR